MRQFIIATRVFAFFFLITGIIYPLVITVVSQIAFPKQANGSFITHNEKKVASVLIGQGFKDPKFFWPRPSAVDYNPMPSGASNLAPTSKVLKKLVQERAHLLATLHNTKEELVPPELVFASASGIDPHISMETAYFQIDRIVKARGWELEKGRNILKNLINNHLSVRSFNAFYINVVIINLELNRLYES